MAEPFPNSPKAIAAYIASHSPLLATFGGAPLGLWVPKEKILQFLGRDAGFKGVVLSFVIGIVIFPGSPRRS